MNNSDLGILKVLATNATGAGGALIQSARPLLGVRADMDLTTPAAVLGVVQFVAGPDGNVSPLVAISGDDGQDNVAPVIPDVIPFALARLTGYDAVSNNWDRVRVQDTGVDIQATAIGALVSAADQYVYDEGAGGWRRRKSASPTNLATFSGEGAGLSASPGEWTANQAPAAATQATATRAAAAGAGRNVCRSITVSIACAAVQAALEFVVRDGATGVGTILWRVKLACPAGDSRVVTLGGLNIVGSAATAMTIESLAAPAATNSATVAMTGYTAIP